MLQKSKTAGFTMIELMVSISIIAIMSSVVIASLQAARDQARDTLRVTNLNSAAKGLIAYNLDNGNFMETGSGCGYNGNGQGWFSHQYPGQSSMSQCLLNGSYTEGPIGDPSGAETNETNQSGYMKYNCTIAGEERLYLYAELQTVPPDPAATDGTCCPNCDSEYGMNYVMEIDI